MIVTFTYPLPDELYVEGVSGEITGTYTYDGPETILVTVGDSGQIRVIDPVVVIEDDLKDIVEIDPTKNPEVAYLLANYFVDEPEEWIYQYEDITMDNGDIYKKPLNPNLNDAYQAIYDRQSSTWNLVQIIRPTGTLNTVKVKESYDKVKRYSLAYEFSPECESAISSYLTKCEEYLAKYEGVHSWKYINLIDEGSIPRVPVIVVAEIGKVPDPQQDLLDYYNMVAEISKGV